MAVAGIVGGHEAFTLVELPVANEVGRRRLLRVVHLSLGVGTVAGLVPKRQLVDGTCQLLAHGERAVALVGGHGQVGEQAGLRIIGDKQGVQHASVAGVLVVQGEEHPLVLADGLCRGVGMIANGHYEVSLSVGAHFQLLLAVAVAQQCACTGVV